MPMKPYIENVFKISKNINFDISKIVQLSVNPKAWLKFIQSTVLPIWMFFYTANCVAIIPPKFPNYLL